MKRVRQILIAEDNLADIELIKSAFDEINLFAEIIIVKDGQALLDFFENDNIEKLALVLLDLNLPKIDGMDILKKFYNDKVLKKIPIVVFTSSNDYDKIITCYEYGANACIKKPDDISEFSKTIRATTNFWLEVNVLPSFNAVTL
ncbi:MAG: response regulator [Saprospiraceae bacterium]|nr:response regulator [Saprospiraceae bacterium]